MSSATQSAVASAPLDNLEVLECRLRELRAEIDAILMQLAGREAAPAAGEPEAASAETALAEASTPWAADEQAEDEAEVDASLEPQAASEPDAPAFVEDQADRKLPMLANDAATESASCAGEISRDDLALTDPIDVDLSRSLDHADVAVETHATNLTLIDGQPVEPSSSEETSIEQASIATIAADPAQEANAVAAPLAAELAADDTQSSASTLTAQPVPAEELVAGAAPATDAAQDAGSASAEMATAAAPGPGVISFEPRQRKQKADFAASRAAPARQGRRVATRIAASIIAMIAAAAALVVADRTALGGTPSRPWVSPLPSYWANWPFQGWQTPTNSVETSVGPAASSPALLGRYREVWPVSH